MEHGKEQGAGLSRTSEKKVIVYPSPLSFFLSLRVSCSCLCLASIYCQPKVIVSICLSCLHCLCGLVLPCLALSVLSCLVTVRVRVRVRVR